MLKIFNRKVTPVRKMLKLDILPSFYKHKNLESEELTIEEESERGVIKRSSGWSESESDFFNRIVLSDYKWGGKTAEFFVYNVSERDVKNFVDEYYSVLGGDQNIELDFDGKDLKTIRKLEDSVVLRKWKLIDSNHDITITMIVGKSEEDQEFDICILVLHTFK